MSPYHANSALYPVLRHLERSARLAHQELPSLRRARFARLFPDVEKAGRAFALLGPALGLLDAMAQAADMSSEAFADFFFDVCTADYAAMARNQEPLVRRRDLPNQVAHLVHGQAPALA